MDHFHLDDYFSAFYCAEDFGFQAKHEIFGRIQKDIAGDFIVIGDRFHDMEIAQKHGLKAIGCGYGYGQAHELISADFIASSVDEIELCLGRM